MSQQDDQIKQLEESNQELKRQIELQAQQIEALKSSSAQSDEERFAPYSDVGAVVAATDILSTVMEEIKAMGDSDDTSRA